VINNDVRAVNYSIQKDCNDSSSNYLIPSGLGIDVNLSKTTTITTNIKNPTNQTTSLPIIDD
jgi:hypothetical protein